MNQEQLDLNTATFVGIDSHPTEHTALAINRFEEGKSVQERILGGHGIWAEEPTRNAQY